MGRFALLSTVVVLSALIAPPRAVHGGCCQTVNTCTTAFSPGACSGTYYSNLLCVGGAICTGQATPCTFGDPCSDGVPSTCDFCGPNIASPLGAFVCTHVAACDDGNACTND